MKPRFLAERSSNRLRNRIEDFSNLLERSVTQHELIERDRDRERERERKRERESVERHL